MVNPIALLSTSDVTNQSLFIPEFFQRYAECTKRKTLILGVELKGRGEAFASLYWHNDLRSFESKMGSHMHVLSSNFKQLAALKGENADMEPVELYLKQAESKVDDVVFYLGSGIHATSINFPRIANRVICLLRPTNDSFLEFLNMLRMLQKVRKENEIGIILDAENTQEFQELLLKIQEKAWKELKYYVEPLGIYSFSTPSTQEQEYDYLYKHQNKRSFSSEIVQLLR